MNIEGLKQEGVERNKKAEVRHTEGERESSNTQ